MPPEAKEVERPRGWGVGGLAVKPPGASPRRTGRAGSWDLRRRSSLSWAVPQGCGAGGPSLRTYWNAAPHCSGTWTPQLSPGGWRGHGEDVTDVASTEGHSGCLGDQVSRVRGRPRPTQRAPDSRAGGQQTCAHTDTHGHRHACIHTYICRYTDRHTNTHVRTDAHSNGDSSSGSTNRETHSSL